MKQKQPRPDVPDDHKYCTGCDTSKLKATEFNKNKSRPDGLQDWCKVCTSAAVMRSVELKKTRELATS